MLIDSRDAVKSAISDYYKKNPKAKQTDLGSASASMPKIDIDVSHVKDTGATATV